MQKDLNKQLDQKDKLFDEAKNGQKKRLPLSLI